MVTDGSDALLVVDVDRLALGVVTTTDFRDHVATARVSPGACVDVIMRAAPPTASPRGRVGDYLLVMMEADADLVALTADGTTGTPVEGIVTGRDLVVRHGTDPVGLARELRLVPSFAELASLHGRIHSLIVEQFTDTTSMGWLLPAVARLQRALVLRVFELATAACAAEGLTPLELDVCWLQFGSAGRQELLTSHDLDYGLVYADLPASAEPHVREQVDALAQRVGAGLRAAGFLFSPGARRSVRPTGVSRGRFGRTGTAAGFATRCDNRSTAHARCSTSAAFPGHRPWRGRYGVPSRRNWAGVTRSFRCSPTTRCRTNRR